MVRVALVEGMKPKYDKDERQRYRRLVKRYTCVDEGRIDKLFNILEVEEPSPTQKNFLDDLITQVSYDSGNWKNLDYEALKKEGVIIEYSGQLRGIARRVDEIDESKVLFVPNVGGRALAPEDEPDYLKHVDWRNKLVLNGIDNVVRFAVDKEIMLSGKYKESGHIPVEDLNLLEQNGFYFIEALKTAINDVLKLPKYEDRVIVAMTIKRRDGTELRLHPHDFVEAAEFYVHCLNHNKEILETLGNKLTEVGDKYQGANQFLVPKRVPTKVRGYNRVEMHYMPDLKGNSPYPLDWMNTRVSCDCPHALNMRNFEMRKGKMTRVAETLDTHANMLFLAMIHQRRLSLKDAVNNMSPIPTQEFSEIVDKMRYNIVQEFRDEEGHLKRTYVGEVGIEKLIHEMAKLPEWTFERMFNPKGNVQNLFLRPMYV